MKFSNTMATLLLGLGLLPALPAAATTIDTYSFTQTGFTDPTLPGVSGTLSGSFTGAVEASGLINATDLSSFHVQFSYVDSGQNATLFGAAGPSLFSFDTNSPGSSLDFVAPIGAGTVACSGAAAAFGIDGCSHTGEANGWAAGFTTVNLASETLTGSATTVSPVMGPAPTTVPEPASLVLLGGFLLILGVLPRGFLARGVHVAGEES